MVSDSQLTFIASSYDTPTYVYDLQQITTQVAALTQALPDAQIRYAVKANPCGAIISHLARQGVGAEVITLGELERAHLAGVPPETIILGGPRQDPPLIRRALELGVTLVSLDSTSQAELWAEQDAPDVRFLPRINPALDPRTHEHLATGAAESKFGMPLREAVQVAERLEARGQLAGFHIHAGSQIDSVEVYDDILALLTPLYERFSCARALDIGGGFAVPGFKLEAFTSRLNAFVRRFRLSLIIEPGRYLVASAGVLLTRVLHVKEGGPVKHVIADAGMADLIRPALYGAHHPVRVLGKTRDVQQVDVDGPLCENADRLGQNLELPRVGQGDLLVVEQVGAYGLTMASNYASSLRPAEVTVDGDSVRLVRRRETVEDLVRLECA
jgi:diaminopimelate decarboxylase